MGDSGEGLVDADARIQERIEERESERKRRGAAGPTGSPGWWEGENPAIDALLTEREREVLQMMAAGLTNSAIAERLVIREGTVKSHVKHILRKIGAVNRAEAIARYLGAVQ